MYEQASERWSPVQSVEKVLLSVISMLAGMCFFPLYNAIALLLSRALPIFTYNLQRVTQHMCDNDN